MMDSTDEYLVKDICKYQGDILKLVEEIKNNLEKTDAAAIASKPGRIADNGEDLLIRMHEYLKKMKESISMYHLGTIIFAIMSKPPEVQE